MRFQQIKELLHYLEQVHHQLGLCYRRLGNQVDSERCRMLLVYLQGREDAASVHLQEYASQLGGTVRETWLDQSFSEDMLPAIMCCELPASARNRRYRSPGLPLGGAVDWRTGSSGPGVPDSEHG